MEVEMATRAIPSIDPNVRFVGVSKLRSLNATNLRQQTDKTWVIQENDTPVAVLLSYKRFLEIQEEFNAVTSMIELLSGDAERKGLLAAFEDLRAGRVRSLREIEAELEKE
jgi:PHD/YefM family antitoxin component YafN of YafNO toxin-antitoxin module